MITVIAHLAAVAEAGPGNGAALVRQFKAASIGNHKLLEIDSLPNEER